MNSANIQRLLFVRGAALLHDTMMGSLAMALALVLRLDFEGVHLHLAEYLVAMLLFGVIVSSVGFFLGMNRGVWRYASLPDLTAIVKASTASVLLFIAAHFLIVRLESIPRSSIIIAWAFLIVLLAAPRAAYRLYRNGRDVRRARLQDPHQRKPVLLVGADDNSELFLRMVRERGIVAIDPLAIIDERGGRVGRFIHGVPVMGKLKNLPDIISQFELQGRRPEALVLTRSKDDYERYANLQDLVELAASNKLEMLRISDLRDVKSLDADIDIRPVKLEDLLQRPSVSLDGSQVVTMVAGRTILVTGAGGSIGSELVRQIAKLGPKSLVLLDSSEYLLYLISNEIREQYPSLDLTANLCNVRERSAVMNVMTANRPDIVFHAAALKHVPIVEAQPLEGIFTNAIGTRNVAEAAIAVKACAMIMVSTDKAVNAANVMGASKRMAEMFCQAMDLEPRNRTTRFVTVRFGNVLGSAGSVVPLFERQLKAGGPLTITHPEIERYFMTIPEACLLILQAASHGLETGNERGRIFVLDMGAPVKIVDLARNLIRLSGLRPDEDIRIVYTGLRPGEKLYEELFSERENLEPTNAKSILSASPAVIEASLITGIFDQMADLLTNHKKEEALHLLCTTVSDYKPGDEIRNILAKRSGKDAISAAETNG
ncbi:polysaccharide biosynthesis protein [Neorhizobium sp. NPDC001467]|uniref:polysaccharide biosynthesis protein n=1 Tax=Neorhizobium sp. NPDC001467 TaxID=3390595 RepID=UPI003D01EF65